MARVCKGENGKRLGDPPTFGQPTVIKSATGTNYAGHSDAAPRRDSDILRRWMIREFAAIQHTIRRRKLGHVDKTVTQRLGTNRRVGDRDHINRVQPPGLPVLVMRCDTFAEEMPVLVDAPCRIEPSTDTRRQSGVDAIGRADRKRLIRQQEGQLRISLVQFDPERRRTGRFDRSEMTVCEPFLR